MMLALLLFKNSGFAPSISILVRRLCGGKASKVPQAGKIF